MKWIVVLACEFKMVGSKYINLQPCLQFKNPAYMWCLTICGDYKGTIVEKYLAPISSTIQTNFSS